MPRERQRRASASHKMADAMDVLVEERRREAELEAAGGRAVGSERSRRISESATSSNLLDRRRRSLTGAGDPSVDMLTQLVAQAASAADLTRTGPDERGRRGSMSGVASKPRTRRISNDATRPRRGSGAGIGRRGSGAGIGRSLEGLVSTRRGSMSMEASGGAAATTALVSRLEALRTALQMDLSLAAQAFAALDADHSNEINSDEFASAIQKLPLPAHLSDPELCDAFFELADADGSGFIDYRELSNLMKKSEKRFSEPHLMRRRAKYLARGTRAKPSRLLREERERHRSTMKTSVSLPALGTRRSPDVEGLTVPGRNERPVPLAEALSERPTSGYMSIFSSTLELAPRNGVRLPANVDHDRARALLQSTSLLQSASLPALRPPSPPSPLSFTCVAAVARAAVTHRLTPRQLAQKGAAELKGGRPSRKAASETYLAALQRSPGSTRARRGFGQATELLKYDTPQRWTQWPYEPPPESLLCEETEEEKWRRQRRRRRELPCGCGLGYWCAAHRPKKGGGRRGSGLWKKAAEIYATDRTRRASGITGRRGSQQLSPRELSFRKQRATRERRRSQEMNEEQIEEIKHYAVNPDSFKTRVTERRRSLDLNESQRAVAQLSYPPVQAPCAADPGIYGGFR